MREMELNFNNLMPLFVTIVCAFLVTLVLIPRFIPVLKKFNLGQEERDDGPESHLKKQGTPTMGGLVILISIVLSSLVGMSLSGGINVKFFQIVFLTISCGVVGFTDDYLKVKRHNTTGLRPGEKAFAQGLTTFIFVVWLYFSRENEGLGRILIPFSDSNFVLPIWLFIPLALFVTLGTDNGVNFTDGLDGLLTSVSLVISALYMALGIIFTERGVAVLSSAVFGTLLAYLMFNVYPARIFMGDTGSLALGGFTSASAFVLGVELYIPIFGFVFMAEVISVIIQVVYFKRTHGKRFFKMAPIHHHFELSGVSEPRLCAYFVSITVLLSFLTIAGILM